MLKWFVSSQQKVCYFRLYLLGFGLFPECKKCICITLYTLHVDYKYKH